MDNVLEAKKKLDLEGDEIQPVWLEIGPGSVLSSLVGQIIPRSRVVSYITYCFCSQYYFKQIDVTHISCLPKLDITNQSALQAVGSLWTYGFPVEWAPLHEQTKKETSRVLELPTYPFQCKDYFVQPR